MAINPIEHIQSKGKQMCTPSNSNIEFTLNSCTFNDSFTKNDSNNMVISRKRVSEDRNHLQPLSVPYHPFSFKPEHDDILNKRRIITRRIIPKTDEKQMDSFLFKLEKTLIENKLKCSERDDECITKRILINDFNSPERSEFEFTFSSKSISSDYEGHTSDECNKESLEVEEAYCPKKDKNLKRKMTVDEHQKHPRSILHKPKKKQRKVSEDELQKKFESLMNAGGSMEIDMRLMDSKLRKINKVTHKKVIVVKSIMKAYDVSRKSNKPKVNVAFDLKNIEFF